MVFARLSRRVSALVRASPPLESPLLAIADLRLKTFPIGDCRTLYQKGPQALNPLNPGYPLLLVLLID